MKRITISFLLIIIGLLSYGQDTTKVLFIGNSFTSVNNLSSLFLGLAQSSNRIVKVASHEPGGVSVGDTNQGTSAHSANPIVYNLIRSEKWDYVIIQDNQGRFVRDSAQFPSTSLVVSGHLRLRDSIIANNSCAKVLWFAGWAYKNGYPPYGNTGIEMIDRLLINYRVLNDTAKDVICPIGEAWKKGITLLPTVNLWSSDEMHPALAGSYLTAATIFATIFQESPVSLSYTAGLNASDAQNLRLFAWDVVSNQANISKYNLNGVISPNIWANQNSLYTNMYTEYVWYNNNIPIINQNDSILPVSQAGAYFVRVKDDFGCYLKSCALNFVPTQIAESYSNSNINIYPNPITNNTITIESTDLINGVFEMYSILGEKVFSAHLGNLQKNSLILPSLTKGVYIFHIKTQYGKHFQQGKIEVLD
jgi:hypothetical protein